MITADQDVLERIRCRAQELAQFPLADLDVDVLALDAGQFRLDHEVSSVSRRSARGEKALTEGATPAA